MENIKDLIDILPIQYNDREIKLMTFKYLDEYVNILRSDFYNDYLDFNFKMDVSKDKLQSILYNLIVSYNLKLDNQGPARLILLDVNTKELIGGCSIFKRDKELELAYFIKPNHQHKNEAYMMLNNIIKSLHKSKIVYNSIQVVIQENNKHSINLAKKLGFIEYKSVNGKYCRNIILRKKED